MMVIGAALTPFSARFAERLGARVLVAGGLILMAAAWSLSASPRRGAHLGAGSVMILVGLAGPLIMPPITAVLLNSVPEHRPGSQRRV